MLGDTEKSSDVCRTASLSEMGHEQININTSAFNDEAVLKSEQRTVLG